MYPAGTTHISLLFRIKKLFVNAVWEITIVIVTYSTSDARFSGFYSQGRGRTYFPSQ